MFWTTHAFNSVSESNSATGLKLSPAIVQAVSTTKRMLLPTAGITSFVSNASSRLILVRPLSEKGLFGGQT